jgi:tetratricopeptide (TPR) repeat protein
MSSAKPTPDSAYNAAGTAFQAGRIAEARDILIPWVEAGVPDARLHGLLGFVLRRAGDTAGAETALANARRLAPLELVYILAQGELMTAVGRIAEAETAYRDVLALAPPRQSGQALAKPVLDALEGLAASLAAQGRPAEALPILEAEVEAGAKDLRLLFALAQAYRSVGRPEAALEIFEQCVRDHPQSASMRHNLAAGYADLQMWPEAERASAEAFRLGAKGEAPWLVRARALVGMGRISEGEDTYRQAVEQGLAGPEIHRDLSQLIWMLTGDLKESSAPQRAVLAKDPLDLGSITALAKLHQVAGDLEGARSVVRDAITIGARDAALHLLLSDIDLSMGDAASSRAEAEKALALDPEHPGIWARLCDADLALGRPDSAVGLLEEILSFDPHNVTATARLATTYRLLGDPRYKALCDYETLVASYELETPEGWSSMPVYLSDLASLLTALHSFRKEPFDQSLRNGSQTSQNLMRSSDPTLRAFFKAVDGPIREHMRKVAEAPGPLGRRFLGDYRIAGCWSVFLRPDGFHADHIHHQGWLSSAFYVEMPTQPSPDPKAGWIKFGEPGQPTQPKLGPEHFIQPKPGLLALFPSYMWHGTVPFTSQERRITIAFDVAPRTPNR